MRAIFFYAKEDILKNIYNSIYLLAKKILFLYNKFVGKSGYSQKEPKPLAETKSPRRGGLVKIPSFGVVDK